MLVAGERQVTAEDRRCLGTGQHESHLCVLRSKGNIKEVVRQTCFPSVACSHCGENANSEKSVCAPVPLFI